jgi:hypothetical protein
MALLAAVLLLDVLTVNQLLNPLAYARSSFEDRYGAPLRNLAAQVAAAPSPVLRLYGPPLAAVGYRNHALQSRVETTYGYNPLELRSYADYAAAAEANPRLIGGLAATHQLGDDGRLEPEANALPLAYFASRVIAVANDDQAQATLRTLDPAAATIVVGPPPPIQTDPRASATVVTRSEASLTVRYASAVPNLLRVAIPAFPGWHARLNGNDVPLLTVDHAFIGVLVPPGQGDIVLAYTPRLFWLGAAISALALLVALLVAMMSSGAAASVASRRVAGGERRLGRPVPR